MGTMKKTTRYRPGVLALRPWDSEVFPALELLGFWSLGFWGSGFRVWGFRV